MKTTQKEAIAMEKELEQIIIDAMEHYNDEPKEYVDRVLALSTSQLSQIKEEIEKEKKLCTPERKDSNEDYERGRISAFEISEIIVSSHMEEKGQGEPLTP